MKQITSIIYIMFLVLFQGCITSFEPKNVETVTNLLIVDGTITTGKTIVKLSRSVGLSDKLTNDQAVNSAEVYIECSDGTTSDLAEMTKPGEYSIDVNELNSNLKYRLSLFIEGKQYYSSFLSPIYTPEIDSISWIKKDKGSPVYICVSTHDGSNNSKYYRWRYKEYWEVRTELFANLGWVYDELGGRDVVSYDLNSSNNIYYCWGTDSSKVLLLGTSDKLLENVISQNKLIEILPTDDKLSELYYVYVEQSAVRKEAYDYFINLQKNIEQTGSIFSPIPSEMRGNIECVSNPELPVIGYIDVSTTISKELYIPQKAGLYEPATFPYCDGLVTNDFEKHPDYVLFSSDSRGPLFAPRYCVDCRTRKKASKNRPYFWPNNHY